MGIAALCSYRNVSFHVPSGRIAPTADTLSEPSGMNTSLSGGGGGEGPASSSYIC